jgi:uncharacterized protein
MNVACQHQSDSTCVALGLVLNEGRLVPRDPSEAGKDFGAACDLGMRNACLHLIALVQKDGPDVFQRPCSRGDGESCFFLASLYYGGAGVPKDPGRAFTLFGQSCASGWWSGCGGLAECYRAGQGTPVDTARAIEYFEKACRAGIAPSCFAAGGMYRGMKDEELAQQRFRQACDFSTRYAESGAAYFKPGTSGESAAASGMFCSEVNP